jgi:hypothetical protein
MPQITINVNSINYTVGYDGTFYSPQGMLVSLNNLGFGLFYIATDGPINYLTTIDDNDVFGDISTSADPILLTTNSDCLGTGFDGEGSIIASAFVGGDGVYEWIAKGTSTGDAIANVNGLDRFSIIGQSSYQFTNLNNGTYYIAIKDNTGNVGVSVGTDVNCASITTTTTTTLAPIIWTSTPSCAGSGISGTGVITLSGFSGGSGTYLYAGIGNTQEAAATNVLNPATRTNITGPTVQFTGLANGIYYTAVEDSVGGLHFSAQINVSCTNTTTTTTTTTTIAPTTSTTTTTTTIPTTSTTTTSTTQPITTSTTSTTTSVIGTYTYYVATRCDDSLLQQNFRTTGSYSVGTSLRYNGYCWEVQAVQGASGVDADSAYIDCTACNAANPTTTSTTTTTTTLFAQTVTYAVSQVDACLNPTGSQNVTGNSTSFCTSTVFNSAGFITLPNGNYVLAYNGDTLNVNIAGAPSTTATVYSGGCGVCPLSTTTTTTSTTQPTYTYYVAQRCDNPFLEQYFRTTGSYSVGTSLRYNGYCWEVQAVQGVSGVDAESAYIDCTSCNGSNPTTSTTTSTTLAPVSLSTTASCVGSGVNGSGRIVANSFSGGSGTYQYAGIGTSEANAISNALNPATRVTITGSSVTFNSLTNDNYYVVIEDSLGNFGISAQTAVSCNATTSTTTTTTTLAGVQFGVSINTKYGTDFLACTGTVTGVIYQKAEFGNTPTVGAQLYTSSTTGSGTEWTPSAGIGLYLMQFGGSTKWSVLVGTTGVINTVTSCVGVSTTTTTTTLPAITVTATPSCDGSGFNGQGRVTANFSGGTASYTWAAIASSEANAIACVNNPSCPERVTVAGSTSYAWTSLANGPYYVAVLDSNGSLGFSSLATVSCNATTTTTTTSSTTTTTTLAGVQFGVSITTKYATDYLACASGTVTGTVYQKAEFGNTPTVGAQLYTSSTTGSGTEWTPSAGIGLYLMQFGGSTKWSVLVGTTGVINTVTSCAGVSTTTTTTTLPSIIVTATPSCDGSGFNGQGRVTANFSGGTSSYTWTAIGTSEAAAIACVNNPSCSQRFTVVGSSSYAFTSLANGPYYVAVLDSNGGLGYSGLATVSCNATTTTTTTTTSSTTTTTTLAGIGFGVSVTTKYATDFLACAGTVTGTRYQKAQFGNTPTVGAQLYTSDTTGSGTEWIPSAGTGIYLMQFGASTKWAVLVGTTGLINSVTSCSGVSTTTTTTLPSYTYYVATRCDNPIFEQFFRTTGSYSVGTSLRYNGYCWEVQAVSGASGVDAENSYIDCTSCNASNPTTSTTTTSTTIAPDCECYTIYNEGGTTGNYTYQRCPDGVEVSPNITAGATQVRCVLAGTTITINSGFLTDVQCGTPCNTQPDCSPC